MNCFLIDFENVRSSGLKGIEHLTNIDDVCIFYSDYANSITFDIHHSMNRSSANITFFKSTKTGKNALDFQLVSYLGYLIAQKKYKNYYVITGDRGFESAISFWKDFFKENKMNYLNIGRFYTIKDALDKKNFPTKTIKDTLPTIPTVESELELRQLKAESIIVDIPSNKIEKRIENSLNTNEKKSSNEENNSLNANINVGSKSKQSGNTVINTSQMDTIRKPVENLNNNNVASKKDKQLNSKNNSNAINKSIETVNNVLDINKSSNPIKDNKKSQSKNTSNNHKQTHSKDESKFKNKSSKINKQSVNSNKSNNNPVQSNNNIVKKGNNTPNGNDNVQNKFNNNKLLNNVNVPKLNYSETVKLPSQATKSTNDTSLFEKINPNDVTKVVEKFEKKLPQVQSQSQSQKVVNNIEPPKKTITPPPVADLVENIKSKEVSQKVTPKQEVSKKKSDINSTNQTHSHKDTQKEFNEKSSMESTKSVKDVKEKEVKSAVIEEKIQNVETKVQTSNVEAKVDTSQVKKSKRGRPRVKSIEEVLKTENKKPKNNKKFQKDIPQDKLSKMIEELIKLPTISKYSKEDLTTICKVIAFGTKNEIYRAFMSLLGKQKALESYHIIKIHFDDLKKIFES